MKQSLRSLCLQLVLSACLLASASAHNHTDEAPDLPPHISAWAKDEVAEAMKLGLVPTQDLPSDCRAAITRRDFRLLAMQYIAVQERYDHSILNAMISRYLASPDPATVIKPAFSDGSREDSLAYSLGLVAGRGDGSFDPYGLITRQEAAVMLTRAYAVIGGSLPSATAAPTFSDVADIAAWARESIVALSTWRVISGLPDGSFAPQDAYTIEQCIVTLLRLYQHAPISRIHDNVRPRFTPTQAAQYLASTADEESFRLEGTKATVVRLETYGFMARGSTSALYLLYPDGGIRCLDIEVCTIMYGEPILPPLEDCHFSDDGNTFYGMIRLDADVYLLPWQPEKLLHKKGSYEISIDVDSAKTQLRWEP